MKQELIALNEKTRRRYGERFFVSSRDARVLKAIGAATDAPPAAYHTARVRAASAPQPEEPDLDVLRAEYERRAGHRADMRWGAARLQEETAAVGRYSRRDMRAED